MRIFFALIFLLGVGGSWTSAANAADSRLKRQVLRNCDAAMRRAPSLVDEDRQGFAEYLARVLELDLPDSPLIPPPLILPGQELFEIDSPVDSAANAWQSFDPLAEYEAKACAVKLIVSLTPEAIVALPSLLQVLDDPRAPDDLKEDASEAALQIAFESRYAPLVGSAAVAVAKLFGRFGEAGAPLRITVLELLGEQTKPLLVDQLELCDAAACEPLLEELYRTAPGSAQRFSASIWWRLMHARDPAVRIAVIRLAAQQPENQVSGPIALERLDDSVGAVRAEVLELGHAVLSSKKNPLVSKVLEALVHFLGHSDAGDRSAAASVLFEFPEVVRRFQKLIGSLCDQEASDSCGDMLDARAHE